MYPNILTKILMVAAGVFLIVVGFISFANPVKTLISVAIFLGAAILMSGIFHLASYFANRKNYDRPGWLLAQGLIDTLIGLLLLSNIGITTVSLPFILAFWMMFAGINRVAVSIDFKNTGIKHWWLMLLTGFIAIILALKILFAPALGAAFLVVFISVFMIYYGFMTIIEAFMLKHPDKEKDKIITV